LSIRERWGISYTHSHWRNAVLWRSINIKNPRGRFLADPFLYRHNNKAHCFVEDFVFKENKGRISVFELGQTHAKELGVCLNEPFHLSFPFLFKYKDELYMCPETCGSRQIRVYRCQEFPLKWELASILMDNVMAADTMLFESRGKWWMLTNIDESCIGDLCSELYLFSSDSPLDENWIPHPNNPILVDSEKARNAGLLIENNRIFRAAQKQGFDRYGESLSIFEITQLTPDAYSEIHVTDILPQFKRGLKGTHHISSSANLTVFDHVSDEYVI
jgi:hypothetical protein